MKNVCACGCGQKTTRTILAVRLQDAETAEKLQSARGLTVTVPVKRGHEGDHGIEGYANGWAGLSACVDYRGE